MQPEKLFNGFTMTDALLNAIFYIKEWAKLPLAFTLNLLSIKQYNSNANNFSNCKDIFEKYPFFHLIVDEI